MARKKVSDAVQADVLVQSRRRCCICYGLNRDTALKQGQIAHLDKDSSNNDLDNLAFLCLVHHDEYDSRASQRKNFTILEAKRYRDELYSDIGKALTVRVHFGDVTLPNTDPFAGVYTRVGTENDSAELTLTPVPDNPEGLPQYHVHGFALWGAERENGPNIGELSVVGLMYDEGVIECISRVAGDRTHSVQIRFKDGSLELTEKNHFGVYGMGVTFNGCYQRAGEGAGRA